MSEQTDYDRVRAEIASFIGTSEEDWDTRTAFDVDSAIKKGIESVIHNSVSHQWSWMRPTFRFKTSEGQRRYTLPLDFEQFIDYIYFDGDEYKFPYIRQLSSGRLDRMQTDYNNNGIPSNYALEVLSHDGVSQQNYQLVLHPTPDGEYTLLGPYQVGPIRSLSDDRPWFPGGPENRELFIAACLAAAESKFMDGPISDDDKQEQFQMALVAAIGRDHHRCPRNLGKMGGYKGKSRDFYRWKLSNTYDSGTDIF